MKLFKNSVGRPSNEIKRKRRIFIFSMVLLLCGIFAVLGTFILCKDTKKLIGKTGETSTKSNYKIGQFVYYDPINNKICGSNGYWTIYNQDTTCYRWVVIHPNIELTETKNGKKITYDTTRLLLDHNIGVGNYDELSIIMGRVRSSWKNSNIVKISSLGSQMVTKLYKPEFTIQNNAWNIKNTNEEPYIKNDKFYYVSYLYTNTKFYYSGNVRYDYNLTKEHNAYKYNNKIDTKEQKGGYWLVDSFDDNNEIKNYKNYSYYLMETGYIGISSNDVKRGVRPTIHLKNSILNKTPYIKTNKINSKNVKKVADGFNSNIIYIGGHKITHNAEGKATYKDHGQLLKENEYYYPQGFVVYGKDKFLVYMMHRIKEENGTLYNDENAPGVLLRYDGKNFGKVHYGIYNSYHGNAIAYNSKKREFYISTDDPKNDKRISKILNSGELEPVTYNEQSDIQIPYYSAFAFDSEGKNMYGVDGYRRIVVRDAENYKVKYTFDSPILETLQSITYSNGYLYLVTYEAPKKAGDCDPDYQLYCYNAPGTATIYVYNVKFDSDGKPSNLFGNLVKKMNTNDFNKNEKTWYEVEGIGAYNNDIYLGFAKKLYITTKKSTTKKNNNSSESTKNVVVPVMYKFTEDYKTISYYNSNNKKIAEQKVLNGTYVSLDTDDLNKYDFKGFKNDKNKTYSKNAVIKVSGNMKLKLINK